MHYYKKTELAKSYGVNPRTVARWIEETRKGKLDLELLEDSGKFHIVRSSKNQQIIASLTQDRRKYLNKKSLKVIQPLPKLYDTYTEEQILEIISGIETYRDIPLKFTYFSNGARYWDLYAKQMLKEEVPNSMRSTIQLLDLNASYLDELLANVDKVNIVDVGPGNALPARGLISHLVDQGKMNRYIAIDISGEMLNIAKKNIKKWFGNAVSFEGYINDISFEPFADITAEPPGTAVNIVLLLGGTLSNFEAPEDVLKVIRKSMARDDMLVHTMKLDSPLTREQFSGLVEKEGRTLPTQLEDFLELLNIDSALYTTEMGYDEQIRQRYIRIRLKQAVTLNFELTRGLWRVDLNKSDTIVVWRARQVTALEFEQQLYDNGFAPLQQSQTADHNYMLVVANLQKAQQDQSQRSASPNLP